MKNLVLPLVVKALPLLLAVGGGWVLAYYPAQFSAFCGGVYDALR